MSTNATSTHHHEIASDDATLAQVEASLEQAVADGDIEEMIRLEAVRAMIHRLRNEAK